MRVNSDFTKFASVHFNPLCYIPSPAFGVNRFLLDRIGDELARATTIVEYRPNSSFPLHTHIGGEEYLVLAGTFHDDRGAYTTDSYVRNPIGSQHAPWVEADGCTILVKLLQMSEDVEFVEPLHVKVSRSQSKPMPPMGCVQELYESNLTGERVQVFWIAKDEQFPVSVHGQNGGEELFVMDGSLLLDNEEYTKWDWLRFPAEGMANRLRTTLRAGADGAQVWCKTGHLTKAALALEKIQVSEDR